MVDVFLSAGFPAATSCKKNRQYPSNKNISNTARVGGGDRSDAEYERYIIEAVVKIQSLETSSRKGKTPPPLEIAPDRGGRLANPLSVERLNTPSPLTPEPKPKSARGEP